MGDVYRVVEDDLERDLALKVISLELRGNEEAESHSDERPV